MHCPTRQPSPPAEADGRKERSAQASPTPRRMLRQHRGEGLLREIQPRFAFEPVRVGWRDVVSFGVEIFLEKMEKGHLYLSTWQRLCTFRTSYLIWRNSED